MVGCSPAEHHRAKLINRTSQVIERAGISIGEQRIGVGGLAPGTVAAIGFGGSVPEELLVDWTEETRQRTYVVSTAEVPDAFEGVIVLEVHEGGEVRMSLQPAIPRATYTPFE